MLLYSMHIQPWEGRVFFVAGRETDAQSLNKGIVEVDEWRFLEHIKQNLTDTAQIVLLQRILDCVVSWS